MTKKSLGYLSSDLVDLVSVVKAITRDELKKGGGQVPLTMTQLRILHHIKSGAKYVGKLSEVFGISQPATSIMVNTLVKHGFLTRLPHGSDRRQIELRLTPKAKRGIKIGYVKAYLKIDQKLERLSAEEKKAVAKNVRLLVRLLSDDEQGATDGR